MTTEILTKILGKKVYWIEKSPIKGYTRVHYDQERYLSNCQDILTSDLRKLYEKTKDKEK